MDGEFGKRNVFSGEFRPPTPDFEAPWGAGQRPLTPEEDALYGGVGREVASEQVVSDFLHDAVGHSNTYDVDAFIDDVNRS